MKNTKTSKAENSTKGFVIKLPKNRARILHVGNYNGEIIDYEVKQENKQDILYLTINVDETAIKQRIFVNFDFECPFIQLLDFFEIDDEDEFDFDNFLGLEIGFHLKQKGGYLNISRIFPPEDIMNYGNQVD